MATTQIQKDHARLLENLRVLQKNFTVKRCAEFIGKSEGAWRYKMKEPWALFSYDEFKSLAKFCKVDFVQLLEGELKLR